MAFIIGLLTFILVVDCAALILLVLIQLPKKEAGAGLAFGSGYTDALFGAGSGNVLTRLTKYATGLFFVLALGLGIMETKASHRGTSEFQRALEQQTKTPLGGLTPPAKPASTPAALPGASNAPLLTPEATNLLSVPPAALAVPASNAPAK